MTIREASSRLLFQLYHLYDNREAANIADLVMENITGWKRIDRVVNSKVKLSAPQEALLDEYIAKLLTHAPVQYVLHEAWFFDMKLYVDENVLIPRPETEELVQWIVDVLGTKGVDALTILDIGTGSGCIPVALKKKLPAANVYACDISAGALGVAKRNAAALGTDVHFVEADILNDADWRLLPQCDVIVSNPPYIPLKEKSQMAANVVAHEPALALFVGNDDPLVFYRAIAKFGKEKLNSSGNIFAEIHEDLARQAAEVFKDYSSVEVKRDMQGKERMVRGSGEWGAGSRE
jgi:release factor glutamine methyltransferase